MVNIEERLVKELGITLKQVQNVIKLLDEGNTVPFISRYRKEQTGGLSDDVLRKFFERLTYLRNLKERKEETFSLEIKRAMEECDIILCVSLNPNNEGRKYVEEERKLYIDTRNKRKPMPYFIVSSSTKSLIEKSIFYTSFDSEMALYKDTASISTMLNTLNQVILKENKRVSDIKLCKNCFRIFHDHNEEGTICLYHPISQIKRTEKGFLFQCCNKLAEAKKNEIPEISPGCMIGKHEF